MTQSKIQDRVLFAVPMCYAPGGARILELGGERLVEQFGNDPATVEEWVEFNLAAAAGGYGVFVWSGSYSDSVGEVRRLTDQEWSLFRSGTPLWSGGSSEEEAGGILVEVTRTSCRNAGWVGEVAGDPPAEGATFNAKERRWEMRIHLVGELASIAREYNANLLMCFPPTNDDALPIVDIQDADDSD